MTLHLNVNNLKVYIVPAYKHFSDMKIIIKENKGAEQASL
jgi:hypothetical protein